ncbi:MAG: metal ABC transporter permease [Desulfovibrio sp.]|jgi:zinc transport system permease protein|nr:metal ABC transporter permease [Desulfovibrio desulfuricans]MBO6171518.1 metal ABC transporter permease [Desulfovibrio sp.]
MPDFSPVYALIALIPLDCLQLRFMQQALLGLLLLAPMASMLGVEVINFRMAFFSDAIGHSAFAGVALGLLLAVPPRLSMPLFGLLVGLGIVAVRRRSALSADTVIGIAFSAVVAFGLAVVSRASGAARDMQRFLYGDILTITEGETAFLAVLFAVLLLFQAVGYNRLLLIALNPVMARAHGVRVALWQYAFAGLLALVVMFSVWAVGVLLVTALLIVPAATARNLARSAGGMFWWALLAGTSSAFAGLVLSAQEWLATSSGATIILVACCWFAASLAAAGSRRRA